MAVSAAKPRRRRPRRARATQSPASTGTVPSMQASDGAFVHDGGVPGRTSQHRAVGRDDGVRHLKAFGETPVLHQVTQFAVHRDGDGRGGPTIHVGQFVAAGWPETWTWWSWSVTISIPRAASAFWSAPTRFSLPGMTREERSPRRPDRAARCGVRRSRCARGRTELALAAGAEIDDIVPPE